MLIVHNLHFEPVKLNEATIVKVAEAIKAFAEFNKCQDISFTRSNNKQYLKAIISLC
jgi:hypothetical protein